MLVVRHALAKSGPMSDPIDGFVIRDDDGGVALEFSGRGFRDKIYVHVPGRPMTSMVPSEARALAAWLLDMSAVAARPSRDRAVAP